MRQFALLLAAVGRCGCLAVVLTSAAGAQTSLVRPQRLPELGRSVASTDDSTALVLNPANLAFAPAGELRWTGTFAEDRVRAPWRGHAVSLGLRLPFALSTGLRLDLVDSPAASPEAEPGPDAAYQWLTWGLALRSSRSVSFGLSLERSFSRGAFGDELSSVSFGSSLRPIDQLGLSLVAQNVNAPDNASGVLGASFTGALAFRPFGTRSLELGLEATFVNEEDVWVPRATLGVDIPHVGRLRGEFHVVDPGADQRGWLAAAGLSVFLNASRGATEAGLTGFTGDAMGVENSLAAQMTVAFKGSPEPVGMSFGRRAVRLRMERTPGPRGHVAWLRRLWSLAHEPRVDAVVLEVRTAPGATLAHVQELRDAIVELRRHGKRVLCHLEDGTGSALYLCAAANRLVLNPAGSLRLVGMRARYFYFARLLEKLGLRAEVLHVGEHKSAPEMVTRDGASDVAQRDKIDLLQQTERQFTEDVSLGRDLSFAAVRAAAKHGPLRASEAVAAGLADGVAFDDQIDVEVSKMLGQRTRVRVDDRRPAAPLRFAPQPSIALVYVEGDMVDGRGRSVPLVGERTAGSYTIADALKAARRSSLVKAVVLRVETPGGSSMAADVIWREVSLTARVKPVIVSMGGYAASGGYYISAPGTRIYANPLTLTGSIGVFFGRLDAGALLDRIGIDVEVYKTSPSADVDSFSRALTPAERQNLQSKLEQAYELFLNRVAEGRELDRDEVDRVARGRVWTGQQARERGLVDEVGGLRQALEHARKLAGLRADAPIVELPKVGGTLLGRLLGVPGLRLGSSASALEGVWGGGLSRAARAVLPLALHRPDVPLMRLDFAVVEP